MRVAQDTHFTDDAAGSEFNLGISDPKRALEDQIKTVGLFPFADDHLALRDRKSGCKRQQCGENCVPTGALPNVSSQPEYLRQAPHINRHQHGVEQQDGVKMQKAAVSLTRQSLGFDRKGDAKSFWVPGLPSPLSVAPVYRT